MAYDNVGYHPVLDMQTAQTGRHMGSDADDAFFESLGAAIDRTPMNVAVIGASAIAILALLKYAGFRFAFGVGARP